jgi:hypothetical protein
VATALVLEGIETSTPSSQEVAHFRGEWVDVGMVVGVMGVWLQEYEEQGKRETKKELKKLQMYIQEHPNIIEDVKDTSR